MNYYKISKEFISVLMSQYVDTYVDFNYGYSLEKKDKCIIMKGRVSNADTQSYLKKDSGIFNAVSINILFNQICFLYLHEVYMKVHSEFDFCGGRGIINEVSMVFNKVIHTNNEIFWEVHLTETFDRKGRMVVVCELNLSEMAAVVKSTCTFLRKNIHKNKTK